MDLFSARCENPGWNWSVPDIHSFSTAIHTKITVFNRLGIPISIKPLPVLHFSLKIRWGKIKIGKIWWLSGKKCYFVSII